MYWMKNYERDVVFDSPHYRKRKLPNRVTGWVIWDKDAPI